MSAWGMTPFDSDDFKDAFEATAGSIRSILNKRIARILGDAERSGDPQKAWTAAGIVLWTYNSGFLDESDARDVAQRSLTLLDMFEQNDHWMRSWPDIKGFLRILEKVRQELYAVPQGGALLPYGLVDALENPRRK